LMAVPITKLYDLGLTIASSKLLANRIGEAFVTMHSEAAKKLGVEAGAEVTIAFGDFKGEAVLKLDDTISTGVVLVPRSMGLPISGPTAVKVK